MSVHLVLHSDQAGPHSRRADQRVLSAVRSNVPRIGYISSSPDPDRLFFRDRVAYYSEIGAKLDVYVDEESVSGDCISHLQQCDAIHLSGGNTFTFARWLRQSNLFDALIHYANSGRPLIGVSAGAIMLTKSIASAALCGDLRPDDVVGEQGLSLVQFGFWPHFSGNRSRPFTEDRLQDTYGTMYGCPNGCAVLVSEMHVESFGQVEVLTSDV